MTAHDNKLIEEANKISRLHYFDIDSLIERADTEEAKSQLGNIRDEKYDLLLETI